MQGLVTGHLQQVGGDDADLEGGGDRRLPQGLDEEEEAVEAPFQSRVHRNGGQGNAAVRGDVPEVEDGRWRPALGAEVLDQGDVVLRLMGDEGVGVAVKPGEPDPRDHRDDVLPPLPQPPGDLGA